VHAGEQVAVDDVVGIAVDDGLLVGPRTGARLVRGDEGRADVGKSAPMACAARMAPPLAMEPDSASGPSNHWRISCISANGLFTPAWPPAPAATAIRPSAPFSMALWQTRC
jgi:hypothetical protein